MSEGNGGAPEINLGRGSLGDDQYRESMLRELSRGISAREIDEADGPHNRPKKIGFNTSLLDQGPTLSDLIAEERQQQQRDGGAATRRQIGFVEVLAVPERNVRDWVVAFWREPVVLSLFGNQNTNLPMSELEGSSDLGSVNAISIVETVNEKFKEILKKMGVDNAGNLFKLVVGDSKGMRVQVEEVEFEKMKTAVLASVDFSDTEKKELEALMVSNYLKKE